MIGIMKFFRDEEYLDSLISGTLYCNTPEFYRQSNAEGVSDKNESCLFSYRKKRGDEKVIAEFNGKEIKNIKCFTAHNPDLKEAWLHCWMTFEIPETDQELECLENDIQRVRNEFGRHFAFIAYNEIVPFLNAVQSMTQLQVLARKVSYSKKAVDLSPTSKDISYSYQREFRFLIGQCETDQVEPLQLKYKDNFSKFLHKNPEIVLSLEGQLDPLFKLSA
ncbi:MAG: hypothetical protein PVI90_19970 [Desulfobacteraceae bacterium]|jgi:hypothetical protein